MCVRWDNGSVACFAFCRTNETATQTFYFFNFLIAIHSVCVAFLRILSIICLFRHTWICVCLSVFVRECSSVIMSKFVCLSRWALKRRRTSEEMITAIHSHSASGQAKLLFPGRKEDRIGWLEEEVFAAIHPSIHPSIIVSSWIRTSILSMISVWRLTFTLLRSQPIPRYASFFPITIDRLFFAYHNW